MAAGHRDGVDQLGAQLVGELAEVLFRELAQIGRNRDAVEQRRAVRDMAVRRTIQRDAPQVRRVMTKSAACLRRSAFFSNKSRCETAWRINKAAWARARSTPRIETKVAFPAAASLPTGLPVSAAEPSMSRRSSAIWKARPRSWA